LRARLAAPPHRARRAPQTARAGPPPPATRRGEVRRPAAGGAEPLDVLDADAFPGRPGRELVDLGRELVEILADELDEDTRCLLLDLRAVNLELLADPALEAALRHFPEKHLACPG